MNKPLYTVVCRYYTREGISEVDLYEVFKKLNLEPNYTYGIVWNYYNVIRHHVYSGQAVEYVIKRVNKNIIFNNETRYFYTHHSPYSIMYDCYFDLKDVEKMNNESIFIRLNMSDKDFYKIYGGKK